MGKTNEEDEKATQAFAALGVGFVCLIVGVPLWWKTTEVYRVQLPYSDIANLGQYRLQYTVLLDVICFDEAVSTTSLNSLTKLLHSINSKGENVDAKYHINVRRAIGDETTAYKEAKSVQDLDEKMARALSDDINRIYVLLIPKSKSLELSRVFVGTHRNVIIQSSGNKEKELSRLISTTVEDVVVSAKLLEKRLLSMKGLRTLKPDKESMRAAKSTPGYDITFTLVSPQPDLLDVRWDIKGGMEAYLKPFTDRIEKYAHLDINSQVLFYTGLLRQPQHHKANNCFFYTPADLPHIINPLEVKLGSHVSTNPSLEFVVYVPYRSQNPLYIYDQNGERSKTNAFLSPQWGGFHIYNVENPRPGSPLPAPVDIDMRRVMEVSLSHLRLLLGVQSQSQASGRVEIAPVGNKAIADWEVDSWLRGRCLENLATSTLTLTSLAQLLGQISNIVIRDEIGREVEISVDSIRQAQKFLSEGELEKAFFFSKQAIISSEKAFFDPSLLELLYFPEDQKFAIYIPLFLPISIPVVMSVLDALKWYRNKNKPEHPKKD